MKKEQIIFHIDVNSAFLSWEAVKQLKNSPDAVDIRTIPSVIGGDEQQRHGIVLAKSIPAGKYGIKTAQPLVKARQMCPDLLIFPPDFSLYVKSSDNFMNYLKNYAPIVEQYSIDEAFCDMTGTGTLYGDPVVFANKLKNEIFDNFGFTVNIGISTNRFLAKMASDFDKPNKVHTLFPNEISTKMWPLPIRNLLFVGKSTAAKMNSLGLHTIGDIANCDKQLLCWHLKKQGEDIWNHANGLNGDELFKKPVVSKSYGNSITLGSDVTDIQTAKIVILSLCETVAARIRAEKSYINVVSVNITDSDFNQQSKQCTLNEPTNITEIIFDAATDLFKSMWDNRPLRLIGVSASHPTKIISNQISMFDDNKNAKLSKLNTAIDKIRQKYGEDSIKRARFIDSDYNHMTGGLNKEKRSDC
ncbi:MAG: DNA polymerase IV [Lachnospira sp.]